ncbi:gliding motility-associated C-terminal domain-containing protein [Fulvivirgaceae bacterium BMA12]|uniref:Gliding motility-associated C-terminal domain-containing protein n=1 Tax=Agaribacillus aureus TaxID=3051825 RepID=A0ABT8LCN3_9BACT|nr:gliding motility-associated C-terminal domain-containing protein [Fulvivirgaceae bacterium BMA12]
MGFRDHLTSNTIKLLICIGISLPVKSQTLFNLGGTEIFISQGETVSITGDVENSGDIINAGTILMAGNWINAGTYNSIQGSFTLNSTSEQHVDHNGQAFFSLTINGPGEKILDSDVLVNNQITFESGLVTPANNSILLIEEGAQTVGGSIDSYVNGVLAIEGTGDKFFPIGKSGKFKPINLYNIQGTTPTIGFEVFEPNNDPQAPKELQAISTVRYWQKTQISGNTSSGRIALSIGEDDGISDLFLAVVTEADQPGEIFQNLGRSETTGDLTEGSVTSDLSITDGNKVYALGQEVDLTGIDCIPGALATRSSNVEERVIKVYCGNISEENFSFKIYNKWGLVVYETTSLQDATESGWDGININTGNPEKNDVYRYVLSGKFLNGNELSRVGTITKIN